MISRGAEPNNLLAWKSEQKREKRLAIHCLSIDTVGRGHFIDMYKVLKTFSRTSIGTLGSVRGPGI